VSEVRWVKLSTEMFDDEKIKAIRSMPSGNDMCLIWIQLISLAGRVNDHGQIYLSEDVPYTETTLSNSVGHPVGTIRLALQTFKKMGMVDILPNDRIALVNWEKHQNVDGLERVRQLTRDRTRKYRDRLLLSCDASVTSRDGTDLELDLDSEEDKKKESTPSVGKRSTASLVTFSFETGLFKGISDQQVDRWADAYPALEVETELAKAAAWLQANPEKRKKNYQRFLVNWLGRSQERGGDRAPNGKRRVS
jgi:predicted phage replisome organizer